MSNTKKKILKFIDKKGQVKALDLRRELQISKQALYKHLHNLINLQLITKIGSPPVVFYKLSNNNNQSLLPSFNKENTNIINDNFLYISPLGKKTAGLRGLQVWCQERNFDLTKYALKYINLLKKYKKLRQGGLINGNKKLKSTFTKVHLDQLFYIDFYNLEIFGKTKLGQLLLYAKQSQSKKGIKEISDLVRPFFIKLIDKQKIDVIAFIPPTVKRQIQFMKELARNLNLPVTELKIEKIPAEIMIPQKTLSKLEDRILNAQKTFVVENNHQYKKVLLIDDAVGSGATLNEIAGQIKKYKLAKKVIGIALTGSMKGFDVISEI